MSEYINVKCPKCGNIDAQWIVEVTEGSGSITFEKDIDMERDIIVSRVDISCPHCYHTWEDMGDYELEDFMNENKVESD